jgi:hypothetical protein
MSVRRCPSCGGLVGPDAEWCGQCFARLERAAPSQDPAPGRTVGGPAGQPVPETEPAPPRPAEAPTQVQPAAPVPVQPAEDPTPGRPAAAPSPSDRGPGDHPASGVPAGSPGPPQPPLGVSGLRVDPEGIVWTCPVCEAENPLDRPACQRCGTPFGRLFEPEAPPPRVSPERAALLSLLFPGIGHFAAGKLADGMARAVLFAFSLGMVLAILLGGSEIGGPLIPLVILFSGVSATLYAGTAVDAYRAARGEPPVFSTRMLLIGATVLLLVAMAVLVLGGSRVPG